MSQSLVMHKKFTIENNNEHILSHIYLTSLYRHKPHYLFVMANNVLFKIIRMI